jgi:hypothetical protein
LSVFYFGIKTRYKIKKQKRLKFFKKGVDILPLLCYTTPRWRERDAGVAQWQSN